MVKINPTQEAILKGIREAKAAYDEWERQAKLEFDISKNMAKEPLRKMVASAMEAGVPVRQIHLKGFDYAQVASMTNFLTGGAIRSAENIMALVTGKMPTTASGVAPFEPSREVRQGHNMAHWTNAAGEAREIERFPYGGNVYYIPEGAWRSLTDEDRGIIGHDGTITLGGDDEIDAYDNDGTVPERYTEK